MCPVAPSLRDLVSTLSGREKGVINGVRTRVGLDARGDLSGADVVEERNILAEDGLEVFLAETLRANLAGVHPDVHVNERADERADTYQDLSVEPPQEAERREKGTDRYRRDMMR